MVHHLRCLRFYLPSPNHDPQLSCSSLALLEDSSSSWSVDGHAALVRLWVKIVGLSECPNSGRVVEVGHLAVAELDDLGRFHIGVDDVLFLEGVKGGFVGFTSRHCLCLALHLVG
jgi:hypothetical protein